MKIYQHIFLSFFLIIAIFEAPQAQDIQVFGTSDYVYQEALSAYQKNQYGRCIQWADQYITNDRGAEEISYSLDKYIHIQSLKYISNLKLFKKAK